MKDIPKPNTLLRTRNTFTVQRTPVDGCVAGVCLCAPFGDWYKIFALWNMNLCVLYVWSFEREDIIGWCIVYQSMSHECLWVWREGQNENWNVVYMHE